MSDVTPSLRMSLWRDPLRGPELRSLYREMWRLGWPAFVSQLLQSVVMIISRTIVGQLGEVAYNSVNIGIQVFILIMTVIGAVGIGTTALVAQAWGAGERDRAGRIMQQSIVFGTTVSLLIGFAGMPLSELLYRLLGADAATAAQGEVFLKWMLLAMPLMAPGFFLAAALRGAGDTRTPMLVGLVMGALSVFFSWAFILGRAGFPAMGVKGAALAIDASFLAFTVFIALIYAGECTVLPLKRDGWRPDFKIAAALLRVGLPSGLEWLSFQLGFLVYIFVIYRYGNAAVAGYFTGITILGLAQTPGFGIQGAVTTMVGQALGAKKTEYAESIFRRCIQMGALTCAATGALMIAVSYSPLLPMAFSELSADALQHTRLYTLLTAFAMPFMGIAFTQAGGLRGAGDTVPPFIATTVGVYGGRVAFAFLLVKLFPPAVGSVIPTISIFWIWSTMFLDFWVRVVVMGYRIASGRWKMGYQVTSGRWKIIRG